MATSTPTAVSTPQGTQAWLYVGTDERGRELEIVAVEVPADDRRPAGLFVIHVMPTHLRED